MSCVLGKACLCPHVDHDASECFDLDMAQANEPWGYWVAKYVGHVWSGTAWYRVCERCGGKPDDDLETHPNRACDRNLPVKSVRFSPPEET